MCLERCNDWKSIQEERNGVEAGKFAIRMYTEISLALIKGSL